MNTYLETADILVLPSKSEGFPKIVFELWNYKDTPIVSPIGILPRYIENGNNGFIMKEVSSESFLETFKALLYRTGFELKEISENGQSMSYKFTFDHYYQHLQKEVFS